MADLTQIIAVTFVAWIVSGVALVSLAWLAPLAWGRTFRLALMLVVAVVFVLSTSALFGVRLGAAAALPAALAVFLGFRRG